MTEIPTLFTVCNFAYLPKALTLAESIFNSNNMILNIVIIDGIPNDLILVDYANILFIENFLGQDDFLDEVILANACRSHDPHALGHGFERLHRPCLQLGLFHDVKKDCEV